MIQRGHGSGFLFETPQAVAVAGQRIRKDFDGDVALEARITGAVNFAHASRAQQGLNFVRTEFCSGSEGH